MPVSCARSHLDQSRGTVGARRPVTPLDPASLRPPSIELADDADVALTLVFSAGSSGGLTIHDGIVGIPDVTIRGSADTIIALSNMPLWSKLGLPIAGRGDKAGAEVVNGVMTALREGRFHMYGAPFHPQLVMRLT